MPLYALYKKQIDSSRCVFGLITHPHNPGKTFCPEYDSWAFTSQTTSELETALDLNVEYTIQSDDQYGEVLVQAGKFR